MNAPSTKQSVLGSTLRGFGYTALTGALMAGIFVGVSTFALPSIATYFAASSVWPTILAVGLSTGIFGAAIQAYSAITGNRQHANMQVASSPVSGRDIAITSASQNLYSPKLQAALERMNTVSLNEAPAPVQQPESTRFRDMVGNRPSLNERVNRRLTGNHADSVLEQREAQALAPSTRTLQ
ncbi:MAG: hypothetical protein C0436_05420 [Alphaproteobacteria bacterium]|nr:hypothetical protein [Alphaproteobacteria bacterium]